MNHITKQGFYFFHITLATIILFWSCANRGAGPQGGAKDETPPVVIKSTPENGAVNHNKQSIEINFNEIVLVEKIAEKVVISPPQVQQPNVKAIGKKIVVAFEDSLKANTTYTIDFSDAIVDNNEKNALENYSFSFSTGNFIDTLQISGTLIDARTLNPVDGVIVGIHSNTNDTAFTTLPFDRITKTDKDGNFIVRNIKQGNYRVYALKDIDNNYLFNQPNEQIAFLDTVFIPTVDSTIERDTLWRDSLTIDTVITRGYNQYYPNDITLKLFQEDFIRQYFIKAERREPHKFVLFFSAPVDTLPTLKPIDFDFEDKYLLQKSLKSDTLTYWLTDTTLFSKDTLSFEITYLRHDSVNELTPRTDSINLVMRKQRTPNKRRGKEIEKEEDKTPKTRTINFTNNLTKSFDINKTIELVFTEPTELICDTCIKFEIKHDTLWRATKYNINSNDIGTKYSINVDWKPQTEYRLSIDSAAFKSLYNGITDKFSGELKTKSLEEYSKLIVILSPYTGTEFIEVLKADETVAYSSTAESSTVEIDHITPGEYFVRLFIDSNKNGIWDSGKYNSNTQPEEVYYFPYKINMRANWDIEEEWNYLETPLLEQRPEELKKKDNKKESRQ